MKRLIGSLTLCGILTANAGEIGEVIEEPVVKPISKFRDPMDGYLDLSQILNEPLGFVPLIMPITEPALGNGAALVPVFIDKPDGPGRPSITGLGAMKTANDSKGFFGMFSRYYLDQRLHLVGGFADMSVNLDFNGLGSLRPPGGSALQYNLDMVGGGLAADWRFGDTPWRLGLRYAYAKLRGAPVGRCVPNMITEDTLQALRMPLVFLNDSDDDWLWGGMIMPGFSGDLNSSDNFSISAAIGAGYVFSPTLRVFGGAYYSHGFENDFFIPGVMFTWRPTPKWEAFLMGPIGGITHSINENWLISGFGQYDVPTWHVDADDFGPDRDITVSSLRLGLKLECRFTDLCWACVVGGYAVARELEDLQNNSLPKDDIDPTPFI